MSNLPNLTQQSDLNEFLSSNLKKEELINLCNELGATAVKSWSKEKLALSIEALLLENPYIFAIHYSLPSLQELKKMLNANGIININNIDEMLFGYFIGLGILGVEKRDDSLYLIMPDNLRDALIPVIDEILKDENVLSWHRIECMYIGLLNCYGILPVEEFLEKFNDYAEDELSLIDILNIQNNRMRINNECELKIINHRYYLLSKNIENPDAIFSEIQKNSNLISRMFSLKEILLAGEPVFVPVTKEAVTLSKILVQSGIPKKEIGFLMHDLWILLENEHPFQAVVDEISNVFQFSHPDQIFDLIPYILDFTNHQPRWSLKGNASSDIIVKPAQPNTPATPKVGRNEPCPCGSGKKYKKCCGSN